MSEIQAEYNNPHEQHKKTLEQRFWEKVDKRVPDECWLWKGACNPNKYGHLRVGKKEITASRIAWILTNGPIPEGLCVLHSCDNPPCCNPLHLFLGTNLDNVRDKEKKGRGIYVNGERCGMSKLTTEKIIEIRKMHKGGLSGIKLAAIFGIGKSEIYNIINHNNWKHISE
jgi:hypothetical protein